MQQKYNEPERERVRTRERDQDRDTGRDRRHSDYHDRSGRDGRGRGRNEDSGRSRNHDYNRLWLELAVSTFLRFSFYSFHSAIVLKDPVCIFDYLLSINICKPDVFFSLLYEIGNRSDDLQLFTFPSDAYIPLFSMLIFCFSTK